MSAGGLDVRNDVGSGGVVEQDRRRRAWLSAHLDVTSGPGLEIGPLCSPVVTRDMADVIYLDVQDAAGLRRHYQGDPAVPVGAIVDVDIALYDDGRLRSIAEATADRGQFAWAVACHVVEHVPDMVGWLQDLAEALTDGGRLALVVPDRRYTFDAARPPTTTGQILAAHLRRDQRPSVRAVYDHFASTVLAPPHELWRGASAQDAPLANPREALTHALRRHEDTHDYIDCHVWVFHAREFVRQLAELFDMGLHPFVVESVTTTRVDELEFSVVLRRTPRDVPPAPRRAPHDGGFSCPPDEVLPVAALPVGLEEHQITAREWAMVQSKRTVLGPLGRVVARFRRRAV